MTCPVNVYRTVYSTVAYTRVTFYKVPEKTRPCRGIYFEKYYGNGGGDGCWKKKIKTEGVGKKIYKKGAVIRISLVRIRILVGLDP